MPSIRACIAKHVCRITLKIGFWDNLQININNLSLVYNRKMHIVMTAAYPTPIMLQFFENESSNTKIKYQIHQNIGFYFIVIMIGVKYVT